MSGGIDIENNSIRCSTVRISCAGISELSEGRVVVTVPKEQIRRVILSHLTCTRKPFLQFFVGFVSVSIGLILGITSFLVDEGDPVPAPPGSFVVKIPLLTVGLWILMGFGFYLLMGIFRGIYILIVETDQGKQRICFDKTARIGEIMSFIEKARDEFGYEIKTPTLEEHTASS